MPPQNHHPHRVFVGCFAIVLAIVVWAALVASLAQVVGQWPVFGQTAFYLLVGLIWIIPLKPLVRWIQTGSFRQAGQDRH